MALTSTDRLPAFYGVGLGPGDPELITVKAVRILTEVDRVYHPSAHGESFAGRILAAAGVAPDKCVAISLGMSRDRRADEAAYRRTAETITAELATGRTIAWAAEGDPLFYSTFLHLYDDVRRQRPTARFEIVPGVSSLHAATAALGVAAASLNQKIAIIPATYGIDELPRLLETFETVFLLKVHSVFDRLLDRLAGCGPVRAWYLEKIGTPEARIVTDLESLRGGSLPYFSLVMLKKEQI